uniref:EGF-like domain-containing protein n=1 Tax=Macrostomum lignano TaxID=282301 RepID=A0A1I8J9B3_9PLAT
MWRKFCISFRMLKPEPPPPGCCRPLNLRTASRGERPAARNGGTRGAPKAPTKEDMEAKPKFQFSPKLMRLHLESSLGRWHTRAAALPLGYGPPIAAASASELGIVQVLVQRVLWRGGLASQSAAEVQRPLLAGGGGSRSGGGPASRHGEGVAGPQAGQGLAHRHPLVLAVSGGRSKSRPEVVQDWPQNRLLPKIRSSLNSIALEPPLIALAGTADPWERSCPLTSTAGLAGRFIPFSIFPRCSAQQLRPDNARPQSTHRCSTDPPLIQPGLGQRGDTGRTQPQPETMLGFLPSPSSNSAPSALATAKCPAQATEAAQPVRISSQEMHLAGSATGRDAVHLLPPVVAGGQRGRLTSPSASAAGRLLGRGSRGGRSCGIGGGGVRGVVQGARQRLADAGVDMLLLLRRLHGVPPAGNRRRRGCRRLVLTGAAVPPDSGSGSISLVRSLSMVYTEAAAGSRGEALARGAGAGATVAAGRVFRGFPGVAGAAVAEEAGRPKPSRWAMPGSGKSCRCRFSRLRPVAASGGCGGGGGRGGCCWGTGGSSRSAGWLRMDNCDSSLADGKGAHESCIGAAQAGQEARAEAAEPTADGGLARVLTGGCRCCRRCFACGRHCGLVDVRAGRVPAAGSPVMIDRQLRVQASSRTKTADCNSGLAAPVLSMKGATEAQMGLTTESSTRMDYYNNWLSEKPHTSNQIYGFYMREEMRMRRQRLEQQDRQREEAQLRRARTAPNLLLPYPSQHRPPFSYTSSRPTTYFVAPPLPSLYDRRQAKSASASRGKVLQLWNTLSGVTVQLSMNIRQAEGCLHHSLSRTNGAVCVDFLSLCKQQTRSAKASIGELELAGSNVRFISAFRPRAALLIQAESRASEVEAQSDSAMLRYGPAVAAILLAVLASAYCDKAEVEVLLPDDANFRKYGAAYLRISGVDRMDRVIGAGDVATKFTVDKSSTPNRLVLRPPDLKNGVHVVQVKAGTVSHQLNLRVSSLPLSVIDSAIFIAGSRDPISSLVARLKSRLSARLVSQLQPAADTSEVSLLIPKVGTSSYLALWEAYELVKTETEASSGVQVMPDRCPAESAQLCRSRLRFSSSSLPSVHPAVVQLNSDSNFLGFGLSWTAQTAEQMSAEPCGPATCLNGGVCDANFTGFGFRCICPLAPNTPWGPRCEYPVRSYSHGSSGLAFTRHWIGGLPHSALSLEISFELSGSIEKAGLETLALKSPNNPGSSMLSASLIFRTTTLRVAGSLLLGKSFDVSSAGLNQGNWFTFHILMTPKLTRAVLCPKKLAGVSSNPIPLECQTKSVNSGGSVSDFTNLWLEIGQALTGCVQSVTVNGYLVDAKASRAVTTGDSKVEDDCKFQSGSCGGSGTFVCGAQSVCYGIVTKSKGYPMDCNCQCLGSKRKKLETVGSSAECRKDRQSNECTQDPLIISTASSNPSTWFENPKNPLQLSDKNSVSIELELRTRVSASTGVLHATIKNSARSTVLSQSLDISDGLLQLCIDSSSCFAFPPIRVDDGEWHSVFAATRQAVLKLRVDGVDRLHDLGRTVADLSNLDLTAQIANSWLRNIRVSGTYMSTTTDAADRSINEATGGFITPVLASDARVGSDGVDLTPPCDCPSTEVCRRLWGKMTCECPAGQERDAGKSCVAVNPCSKFNISCPSGGSCRATGVNLGFECICPPGVTMCRSSSEARTVFTSAGVNWWVWLIVSIGVMVLILIVVALVFLLRLDGGVQQRPVLPVAIVDGAGGSFWHLVLIYNLQRAGKPQGEQPPEGEAQQQQRQQQRVVDEQQRRLAGARLQDRVVGRQAAADRDNTAAGQVRETPHSQHDAENQWHCGVPLKAVHQLVGGHHRQRGGGRVHHCRSGVHRGHGHRVGQPNATDCRQRQLQGRLHDDARQEPRLHWETSATAQAAGGDHQTSVDGHQADCQQRTIQRIAQSVISGVTSAGVGDERLQRPLRVEGRGPVIAQTHQEGDQRPEDDAAALQTAPRRARSRTAASGKRRRRSRVELPGARCHRGCCVEPRQRQDSERGKGEGEGQPDEAAVFANARVGQQVLHLDAHKQAGRGGHVDERAEHRAALRPRPLAQHCVHHVGDHQAVTSMRAQAVSAAPESGLHWSVYTAPAMAPADASRTQPPSCRVRTWPIQQATRPPRAPSKKRQVYIQDIGEADSATPSVAVLALELAAASVMNWYSITFRQQRIVSSTAILWSHWALQMEGKKLGRIPQLSAGLDPQWLRLPRADDADELGKGDASVAVTVSAANHVVHQSVGDLSGLQQAAQGSPQLRRANEAVSVGVEDSEGLRQLAVRLLPVAKLPEAHEAEELLQVNEAVSVLVNAGEHLLREQGCTLRPKFRVLREFLPLKNIQRPLHIPSGSRNIVNYTKIVHLELCPRAAVSKAAQDVAKLLHAYASVVVVVECVESPHALGDLFVGQSFGQVDILGYLSLAGDLVWLLRRSAIGGVDGWRNLCRDSLRLWEGEAAQIQLALKGRGVAENNLQAVHPFGLAADRSGWKLGGPGFMQSNADRDLQFCSLFMPAAVTRIAA